MGASIPDPLLLRKRALPRQNRPRVGTPSKIKNTLKPHRYPRNPQIPFRVRFADILRPSHGTLNLSDVFFHETHGYP